MVSTLKDLHHNNFNLLILLEIYLKKIKQFKIQLLFIKKVYKFLIEVKTLYKRLKKQKKN